MRKSPTIKIELVKYKDNIHTNIKIFKYKMSKWRFSDNKEYISEEATWILLNTVQRYTIFSHAFSTYSIIMTLIDIFHSSGAGYIDSKSRVIQASMHSFIRATTKNLLYIYEGSILSCSILGFIFTKLFLSS